MNLQQLYACYPKIDRIVSLGNEIRESNPEIARLCDFVTEFVADVIAVTSGQPAAPLVIPKPEPPPPPPPPAAPAGFTWQMVPVGAPPEVGPPITPPAAPAGLSGGLWGNPGYTPGQ